MGIVDRRVAAWHLRRRNSADDVRRLPEATVPAGTDRLPAIRHIVLLMMENHSFDNYLGMLGRGEGFPLDAGGMPISSNRRKNGTEVRAHECSATTQVKGVPSQAWHASHQQYGHGGMDGFVTSIEEDLERGGTAATTGDGAAAADFPALGMGYWTERHLPFYAGLARAFPVADRWFCSCLGPTFPNRRFLIAGTANGLIDDLPFHLLDYPPNGTIFDMLTRHGISWANYHPVAGDKSRARRLAHYRRRRARRTLLALVQGIGKVTEGIEKDIQFTADLFPLGIGQHVRHVHGMDQFFAEADAGALPAFSIVDPAFDEF